MSGFRPFKIVKFAVVVAVAVAVGGLVVMSLWNWLIPPLIGWHSLSFVQALGLLVLCRILFGGFRGRGGHGWRHSGFRHMSDEERERFRNEMRSRCGRAQQPEQPA